MILVDVQSNPQELFTLIVFRVLVFRALTVTLLFAPMKALFLPPHQMLGMGFINGTLVIQQQPLWWIPMLHLSFK